MPQLLSLCSGALKLQLLKPVCLEPVLHKRGQHSEKPGHRNQRVAPALRNQRKLTCSIKDAVQQKLNYLTINPFFKKEELIEEFV